MHRRRVLLLALAGFAFAEPALAQQQKFPQAGKPVRIIVPFPAGGQTDIQARAIGQKLADSLGVSVIVENKPGASTVLGAREVQRAEPDGHTLLYTIAIHVQLPHLYRNPPWNPFADFTPVTTGARSATVLTAHASVPFNTIPELVAHAKANPGKLNYASFGTGTTSHLNGALFARRAGIELVHVPYRGSGEAMKDHLAGNVELFFDGPTTAMSNAQSGKVKLIAAAAETRYAALPELPTLREQGFDIGMWGFLWFWGPAGMPPEIVDAVYGHLAKAIKHPEIAELFAKGGSEISGMPPAEMAREAKSLSERWGAVIRELGVKLEQ